MVKKPLPKEENISETDCPILFAMDLIGQKWKLPILWYIADAENQTLRYRELERKVSNVCRCDSVSVYNARNLNACFLGKIGNATIVDNVTADDIRNVCNHSFHYVGCVFACAFVLNNATVHDRISLLCPTVDLVYTAARIFVKRNVELLDKIVSALLDVEGIVLSIVLTGLCAVVAELVDIVEANHIVMLLSCVLLFSAALDLGIEVISILVIYLKEPCHVVDTRDLMV